MRLVRFGISMPTELLEDFDRYLQDKKYHNRSEAIRDLIRDTLVKSEWTDAKDNQEVVGTITFVYDHHKRELVNGLLDIQHDYDNLVVASQHIHLDHDHCLEVTVVKGSTVMIRELADKIRSMKGVKHAALNMTTTGKSIR